MRGIASLKGTVRLESLQNWQRNHCLITRAVSRQTFESSRIARLLDLLLRLATEHPRTRQKKLQITETESGHPSLHFKKVGDFVSARVGISYRVLGVNVPDGILWFWIGRHAEYDRIIES
jgi:hypothetical protein